MKENFTVRLTKEDIDKTYKILYGNSVLTVVIYALFSLICFILNAIFKENTTSSALFGAFLVFLITGLRWIRNISKHKEKRIGTLYEKRTDYEIFEDHMDIVCFKNDLQYERITVRQGDIENVYTSRDVTLFTVNDRVYTLPNSAIIPDSCIYEFFSHAENMVTPAKRRFNTVSALLVTVTFLITVSISILFNGLKTFGYVLNLYAWVYYVAAAVPLVLTVYASIGIKKYKTSAMNLVVGIFLTVLMCLLGLNMSLVKQPADTEYIEELIHFDIPDGGTLLFDQYGWTKDEDIYYYQNSTISYSESEKETMLNRIAVDARWRNAISDDIRDYLPENKAIDECEYFMFLDQTSYKYNTAPTAEDTDSGEGFYMCCFLCFDTDSNRLYVYDYELYTDME